MSYIPISLRRDVSNRAKSRCEYCRLPEAYAYYDHEIDHIYAEKHGGKTESANLCLACTDCNRHKSSDLCSLDPDSVQIVRLFHPRNDDWLDHFELLSTGIIQPKSAEGRVTARILGFNHVDLVLERARLLNLGVY